MNPELSCSKAKLKSVADEQCRKFLLNSEEIASHITVLRHILESFLSYRRFNPMARKRGGSMANAYVPPSSAQKNEYGFVIFAYLGVDTDEGALHGLFSPFGTVAKVSERR